jgi:hypothetical protein
MTDISIWVLWLMPIILAIPEGGEDERIEGSRSALTKL